LSAFLMLIFCSVQQGYSQSYTPCTTAVNLGNFGVDAELYANTDEENPIVANGDDWFFSSQFPGPNIGVIGLTAATAQPPLQISVSDFNNLLMSAGNSTGRNLTYEQRMSVPFLTPVNGYLMLDAVAARDNNSAAAAKDSSAFAATADKNADNPLTWV